MMDGVTVTVDGSGVEVLGAGGRKVVIPVQRPSSHSAPSKPKPAFGGHAAMQIKPAKPKPKKPAKKKPAPNPVPPPAKLRDAAPAKAPKPGKPDAKAAPDPAPSAAG